MTFKATVRRGKVVVSGVDLPNGTPVDVTVEQECPIPLAVLDRIIRETDKEIRRGEVFTIEETFEHLRQDREARRLRRANNGSSGSGDTENRRTVGSKPRGRTKRVPGRAR